MVPPPQQSPVPTTSPNDVSLESSVNHCLRTSIGDRYFTSSAAARHEFVGFAGRLSFGARARNPAHAGASADTSAVRASDISLRDSILGVLWGGVRSYLRARVYSVPVCVCHFAAS